MVIIVMCPDTNDVDGEDANDDNHLTNLTLSKLLLTSQPLSSSLLHFFLITLLEKSNLIFSIVPMSHVFTLLSEKLNLVNVLSDVVMMGNLLLVQVHL